MSISRFRLLRGQPFQRILADGPEPLFVHVAEEALFQIGVAQLAGIVVAQHPFDLVHRQHVAHDVENCVVIQRVADLLELFQQPVEHMALDGVGGHEVEDQAVFGLAVAVDAPHALLQPVRVPRDVIVEEDVADLEIDALAGGLSGHQHLDVAIAELLLGVEACPLLVAGTGAHPAVNLARAQPPRLQALHQVVERILELGEDEQALGWIAKEALAFQEFVELSQFRFLTSRLHALRLIGQPLEVGNLRIDLAGVACQRHRRDQVLDPLALLFLHLLQLIRRRAAPARSRATAWAWCRPSSRRLMRFSMEWRSA